MAEAPEGKTPFSAIDQSEGMNTDPVIPDSLELRDWSGGGSKAPILEWAAEGPQTPTFGADILKTQAEELLGEVATV